ncbi:hypothetical protein KORDIASMS9_00671 [Kordia sp. SMS9]|uniref:hypothetical protein n=1 Tax=Kordia sp. SMS9 TaxID=2282170 RepID=UPI000E103684|nr:hypothetical protein [Kordia sp. SMS9]AXG68456.1 hypothetical protein KORDIASMS9_00671 [Kordia sp. SMS9]
MKKKNLSLLRINKTVISSLDTTSLNGGRTVQSNDGPTNFGGTCPTHCNVDPPLPVESCGCIYNTVAPPCYQDTHEMCESDFCNNSRERC